MKLQLTVTGDGDVARALRGTGGRAANARPALEAIAEVLRRSTRQHFATQGSGKWPDLSSRTIGRHGSHPVMRLTDVLYRSLTERGVAGSKTAIRGTELTYGTTLRVAGLHAKRRPLINVRAADRRRATEIVRRWIVDGRR